MSDDGWPEPIPYMSNGNVFYWFPERWIDVCGIRLEDLQLEDVDSEDGSTDADQGLTSEARSGRISNADTV